MSDEKDADAARQRVVRVPGSRRARLTPVAGTDPEPETASGPVAPADAAKPDPRASRTGKGPNDDRLFQDVPPHY